MESSDLTTQDLEDLRRIREATIFLVKPCDVADLVRDKIDRNRLDQPMALRMLLRLWAGDDWRKYRAATRHLGLD